jgi:hypothetical protein
MDQLLNSNCTHARISSHTLPIFLIGYPLQYSSLSAHGQTSRKSINVSEPPIIFTFETKCLCISQDYAIHCRWLV